MQLTSVYSTELKQKYFGGTGLTFFSQGSPHNILPNVILFGQVEELADLACPLGTKTARDSAVGQPWDVLLT